MTVLSGQDSVSASGMTSGHAVYCGYGAGSFKNISSVMSSWPGKKYISISPYSTGGVDCLDIETGDATPSAAPGFVRSATPPNLNKPMLYANGSTMPAVISALNGAGIPRSDYYLWVAEWNGSPTIPSGYDGKQYASTSGYDSDSFNDYIFGPVGPPPIPHLDVLGWELRRPADGIVPAVFAWWGDAGATYRQANIPQELWNAFPWTTTAQGNPNIPASDPDHLNILGWYLRRPANGIIPAVVAWWGDNGATYRQANFTQDIWNQIVWSTTPRGN